MTKYFKNTLLVSIVVLTLFPTIAFAEGILPPCAYENGPACHYEDLVKFANIAIDFIIKLALVVTPISFAYAGFIILTSGGDEGKLKKGKEILVKVGIGFAVILASFLFISFIMNTFTNPQAVQKVLERK